MTDPNSSGRSLAVTIKPKIDPGEFEKEIKDSIEKAIKAIQANLNINVATNQSSPPGGAAAPAGAPAGASPAPGGAGAVVVTGGTVDVDLSPVTDAIGKMSKAMDTSLKAIDKAIADLKTMLKSGSSNGSQNQSAPNSNLTTTPASQPANAPANGNGGSNRPASGSSRDRPDGESRPARKDEDEGDKPKSKLQMAGSLANSGLSMMFSGIQKGFGIVQQIYERVKSSSQFLQTVESLFNLAMTLLLMPLGNALAETILPSIVELVENVTGLWDVMEEAYNNGGLAGILGVILEQGLHEFAQFFNSIGSKLEEEGGLIGSIGTMLTTIGNFVENGLATVLQSIFTVVGFVASHLKEFIALYIAYQTALIAATLIASISPEAKGMGYVIGGAAIVTGVGSYAAMSAAGMADGGYVPPTPGGQLTVIGEGGEGEYVIPESKISEYSSSGTIINNFYGYTSEELVRTINDVIAQQVANSTRQRVF